MFGPRMPSQVAVRGVTAAAAASVRHVAQQQGRPALPVRRPHRPLVVAPRAPPTTRRRSPPGVRRAAYPPGWEDQQAEGSVDANWPHAATDSEAYGQRQRGGSANVTVLSREQSNALLPGSATGSQYSYYFGGADTTLRRVSASVALMLLTVNVSNIMAVPFGLYWLWSPVALAARRNAPFRRYEFTGIWRAKVLGATAGWEEARSVSEDRDRAFDALVGLTGTPKDQEVLRLLLGDDSGARVELEVPYRAEHQQIRLGDVAHVAVVSDSGQMTRFRAIREAYLPESQLWVADYPFCERSVFLYMSERIEEAVWADGRQPRWI